MNEPVPPCRMEQPERELAQAILAYLAEHPHAMDTLGGIAEWWLLRQRIRVEVERVERVLRQLAAQGQLEAFGTGAQRRYRLKQGTEN
jgi:hypothetical protein